jgi:hypothetical protein
MRLKKNFTSKYILWVLGCYQTLAGIFGYYLVFQQPFMYIFGNFLFFSIIIGLFSFSIISGLYLFQGQKEKGIHMSLINQILQLVQFKILGFGVFFVAGSYIGVGFTDTPELHFLYNGSLFQSSCFIDFKTNDSEISIVLNLVALSLVVFLSRRKRL